MTEYTVKLLDSYDRNRDTYISRMLRQEGKTISREHTISMVSMILFAGYETTSNMIVNTIVYLLMHPEQLEKLKKDPNLTPNAIEECLRHVPSSLILLRTPLEELNLGDQTLSKGQSALCLIREINYDPVLNEEPHNFDITRKNVQHISFGRGIHICIGKTLARTELRITLNTMLQRFPNMRLPDNYILEWDNTTPLTVRMRNSEILLQ